MTEGKRVDLAHPVVMADWPRVLDELGRLETAGPQRQHDLLLIRLLDLNNFFGDKTVSELKAVEIPKC